MTVPPDRRIAPPDWLARESAIKVLAALPTLRFVGGAVRNTLLGRPVEDLDAATPLTPPEIMERLGTAGIRVVPTGLAHGTVSAVIGGETVEITTLRRDVTTDGRHAEVAFTEDWAADAARRDFTMNALYLDGIGQLWDPVEGYADCLAGRIRFVGDPVRRIEEDALRLLRFYRMHALYGCGALDLSGRNACSAHASDMTSLSGERIAQEIFKLLKAVDPAATLRLMVEDGIWRPFLSADLDVPRLAALVALEPAADPLRRLAALLPAADMTVVAKRLRLSRVAERRLAAMTDPEPAMDLDADCAHQQRLLYRLDPPTYRDRVLLHAAGDSRTDAHRLLEMAAAWRRPVFPISGADALAAGVPSGPGLGDLLRAVELWWIDDGLTASREACLAQLRDLANAR